MSFVVSARKYRPQKFSEVVGQEHISSTLKNALKNDHLAHAFLFCGPRGVGKTTCARILAKLINCENKTDDFEACGICSSCKAFEENASFNIHELDAASNNSVEHIRALIEQVRFQPQQGKYKVYIIDEVHMLSTQAFNAFLKTLEEPPAYAKFILATTEKHKIIPTILSRCQIFDFNRITVQSTLNHLIHICQQESIKADEEALRIIAQKADGALRDALSIFDRMVSFSGKELKYSDVINNLNILDYDYYFKIVDVILLQNQSQTLLTFDTILKKGFDPDIFLQGFSEHARDLLVAKDISTLSLLEVSENIKIKYINQASACSSSFLMTTLHLINDCDIHYKEAKNKRLHVEIMLLKLCYLKQLTEASLVGEQEKKNPSSIQDLNLMPTNKNPVTKQIPKAQHTSKIPNANETLPQSNATSVTKLNLTEIELEIELNENKKIKQTPILNQDLIQNYWTEYSLKVESGTQRALLQKTKPLLSGGNTIKIVVSSNYAKESIIQETGLMDFIRTQFQRLDLILEIDIDSSELEQRQKELEKNKPLTDNEKLKLFNEANPAIKKMWLALELQVDNS